MGTLASKDTRRISFDNKFALSSAAIVAVPKAIIEDKSLINFDNLATESGGDIIFDGSGKNVGKNVEVLEENNTDYWAHRMDNLKKEHQAINKIIEIEYDKQIKSTNEVYSSPKVTQERLQKIKPCFEWRTKTLQCYEENYHQPLVCSAAVQAFTKCVATCRGDEGQNLV